MSDYRKMHPKSQETEHAYARRLEVEGYDEMFIRKAIRAHFSVGIQELGDFFEDYPLARMRHVAAVAKLRDYPSDRALAIKLSKNLGIEVECADELVRLLRASDTAS